MYRVRSKSGGVTTTLGIYGYNPANERTSKQDVAHGHNYSYIYGDGHALVAERQDTSQWTNYFWFGGQLVGMSRGGALYQIDNDHLGRPELITDASKAIAWQSDNDAFGEHRSSSTSGALSGTFHVGLPGQYFDTETNYWYNMNRYYVAEIGRYLQPDPIGMNGGVNPYVYVKNNPANASDPLGLMEGIGWANPIGYIPDLPDMLFDAHTYSADFYSLSGSLYIATGAIYVTRAGSVFFEGGIGRGYPNPVRAFSISLNAGALLSSCTDLGEREDMTKKFLNGLGYSVSAYDVVGGGMAYSPGSGAAVFVGVGAGVEVSPGAVAGEW